MNYVLSATLQMKDDMTPAVKSAGKSISEMKGSLESASKSAESAAASFRKTGQAASSAAPAIDKMQSALKGASRNYKASFSLQDRASGVISQITSKLNSIKGKTYTAFLNVRGNMAAGNGPLGNFKSKASDVASGMLMGTGMQMAGAAGIGFGLFDAVKGYMDFEQEMSAVKAISGATDDEFKRLTDSAMKMGAETKFSAKESAQALEYMGMAGWKADEMIAGLPGVMNLAAASGEDLGRVSDIVTDAMTSFKLAASDATMFSDVLAATATNSNTNVSKMGYTFQYVAPLAGALGYTIQDTALAIGAMADAGIKGEQAGTSLRALMTRLVSPTKDTMSAMQTLGLSVTDSTGKMRPLRDILDDIRRGFNKLEPAERGQIASDLAGQEAMSGLLGIVNESDEKYNALAKAIDNSSGAAKRMAGIRMDNLRGDLEYLSGDWDSFTMSLMSGKAGSGLRSFVKEADSLLSDFSKSVNEHGLGARSLLSLLGDAVNDLKNKFLEMDGIGSLLAGGALAAGLYKITRLTASAVSNIKKLTSAPSELPGAGGMSTAKDMVVNARTVIVNGKVTSGGSAAPETVPGTSKGGKTGAKAFSAGKWINRALMGLSLLSAGYDIYNASPEERGSVAIHEGGQLAGMWGGAKIGASIGTAVAPGAGTIVGATLGGIAGGFAGNMAVDRMTKDGFIEAYKNPLEMDEDMSTYTKGTEEYTEKVSEAHSAMWESIKDEAEAIPSWFDSTIWSPIAGSASSTGSEIADAFSSAWGEMQNIWSGAAGWFDSNVAEPIANAISKLKQNRLEAIYAGMDEEGISYNKVNSSATGSAFADGGLTQINEHGGELIDLPQGSRIYPAGETSRIIQNEVKNDSRGGSTVNVTGNTFVVRNEADMDSIAYKIAQALEQGYANFGGA